MQPQQKMDKDNSALLLPIKRLAYCLYQWCHCYFLYMSTATGMTNVL